MSNSLIVVKRILYNYVKKETEVFGEFDESLDEYVLQGVSNAGVLLGKMYFSMADHFGVTELEKIETPKMGNSEIKLAALCSYLEYALNFHQNLTSRATNFSSKSFSVTGTTEKAKEAMRIVWWIEGQLEKHLDLISRVGIPDADPPIEGSALSSATVEEILFSDNHFVF